MGKSKAMFVALFVLAWKTKLSIFVLKLRQSFLAHTQWLISRRDLSIFLLYFVCFKKVTFALFQNFSQTSQKKILKKLCMCLRFVQTFCTLFHFYLIF